jgi:hypothetical protein
MPRLLIKYGNGSQEEVVTNAASLEDFINEKFGSAHQAFVDGGGTIALADTLGDQKHTVVTDPVVTDPVITEIAGSENPNPAG